MQTRKQSLIEVITNIASGLILAFLVNIIAITVAPYIDGFEYHSDVRSLGIMTVLLTTLSIIRSYFWRRYFNKRYNKIKLKDYNFNQSNYTIVKTKVRRDINTGRLTDE